MTLQRDLVIIGGCGRVGLPLGLAFATRGLMVTLHDINADSVAAVNSGRLPFDENEATAALAEALDDGRLTATTAPEAIGVCEQVIVVIGTPVDKHLNPDMQAVSRAIGQVADHFVDGQLIVLRSTVYPGVTSLVAKQFEARGLDVDVSFCPERIAEGTAMTELFELPQIVSGVTDRAADRAEKLFRNLTGEIVRLSPEEAELAKLFTNSYRYIKFAIANQFFMIANDFGLDYERIRRAITFDYPRAADMPGAGFAAGPCLFKDTAQLAAFNNNNFLLGQAAMSVNEGLPLYLVSKIEEEHDLSGMTVGILGMAFKAGSDDVRSSLSYKLKRLLGFKAKEVLCTDPYVKGDRDLVPLEEVVARSDLLILATPHPEYRSLQHHVPLFDIWSHVEPR